MYLPCGGPTLRQRSGPGLQFCPCLGGQDAGQVWVLTKGEPTEEPSTTLSYEFYFEHQLDPNITLQASEDCGPKLVIFSVLEFEWKRNEAPQNRPIYHRLHNLESGFPDVILTEPRSIGPLADDPYVKARRFLDSDPGEDNPLGRAEIMKLAALLIGSVETENALFDLIQVRYDQARSLALQAKTRTTVMVGKPGTWNEAARSSWMITVGTTCVGRLLRDANVEYRNSDDDVNKAVCGSGCGGCPSGTIAEYLDLFRSTDDWIAAGIGANCCQVPVILNSLPMSFWTRTGISSPRSIPCSAGP